VNLVISWGVENGNISSLNKVTSDDKVFLIWADFNVMGSNDGLDFIGVSQQDRVAEIRDIKSSNVVGSGEGQVDELSIIGDISVDSNSVLVLGTEVV
jgi:hypothetical protein